MNLLQVVKKSNGTSYSTYINFSCSDRLVGRTTNKGHTCIAFNPWFHPPPLWHGGQMPSSPKNIGNVQTLFNGYVQKFSILLLHLAQVHGQICPIYSSMAKRDTYSSDHIFRIQLCSVPKKQAWGSYTSHPKLSPFCNMPPDYQPWHINYHLVSSALSMKM